jgi:signal transduction histidine kinase
MSANDTNISSPSASVGMRLHPLTLNFRDDRENLEELFQKHYFILSLPTYRLTCFFGLVLYALFGILDAYLVPESKNILWFIRYMLFCPLSIAVFLLTFTSLFKRFNQLIMIVYEIMAGAGIIAMIVIAPPPACFSYYAGLILVLMMGYMLKIRFIWSTIGGWLIILLFEIAATLFSQTPIPVIINNNFFFISANIIGMLSSYTMERYARRDFYLAYLLTREQKKVRQAKKKIEEKVLARTSELQLTNDKLHEEITIRRQAEEARNRLENELLQARKMEALGTMAAGIAHDFNNILSSITGYTDLALLSPPKDKEMREYLEGIQKGAYRAGDLVSQIMIFSRNHKPKKRPTDIIPLIREVLKLLQTTIPTHIAIKQNFPRRSAKIMADPTQIHQVLMNLCTNALHAMADKPGLLGISVQEITLKSSAVTGLADGKYINLSISDTGHGMDKKTSERIFEPFFTTKEINKGTGMGLAVVHGIVQNHNGAITVESTLDKGTTFHLYFPVAKGETE